MVTERHEQESKPATGPNRMRGTGAPQGSSAVKRRLIRHIHSPNPGLPLLLPLLLPEAYIATDRQKHGEHRVRPRGSLPKGATRVERMTRKLKTKAGAAIYAARKAIVEPVFGQIRQARGFRRFSLSGLAKERAEWAFVCLTHNILKLYRMCYA